MILVIDEAIYAIAFGEPEYRTDLVIAHTPDEIVGNANIKRAIRLAREDVHGINGLILHLTCHPGRSA
jgi:hypothetical protein